MAGTRDQSDLRIRRARIEDATRIRDLHVRSIRELASSHYTTRQIAAWSDRRKPSQYRDWERQGLTAWVAEIEGRIAGFAAAGRDQLHFLFVHPGQIRKGVGSALLRVVERKARRGGAGQLLCPASLNAVSFYRKHGLRCEGRGSVLFGETRVPYLRMRKIL